LIVTSGFVNEDAAIEISSRRILSRSSKSSASVNIFGVVVLTMSLDFQESTHWYGREESVVKIIPHLVVEEGKSSIGGKTGNGEAREDTR